MKHSLWVIAMVVVAICLAACKKDKTPVISDSPQPDTSRKYYPMQIKSSNVYINYTYGWGELPGLSSVQKVYDNLDTMYAIYYNDLDQPISFSSFTNGIRLTETQYTLNVGGDVIRGDVYNVKMYDRGHYTLDTLKAYYIITYNILKQLTLVKYFYANGEKDHDEFFYYTSNGNIREVNSSVNINLEYDQFNGLGKNVKNSYLFYIEGADHVLFHSKNNPIKSNGVSRAYKYNIDNYPVEMTIQNAKGPQVFKITYYVTPEL